MERGFVRTGWTTYQPELDDDLLDGHGWLCKEHRKAIWHTTMPLPLFPRYHPLHRQTRICPTTYEEPSYHDTRPCHGDQQWHGCTQSVSSGWAALVVLALKVNHEAIPWQNNMSGAACVYPAEASTRSPATMHSTQCWSSRSNTSMAALI
jgi:hypothetical protein